MSQIDLNKDSFHNPYYPSKKKIVVNKKVILSIIFLLVFGYWFYLVFYSPVFKIKNIIINDLEYIDSLEVENIIKEQMDENKFIILHQDSFFLLDKEKLVEKFKKNFLFKTLTIKKQGLNRLRNVTKEN